MPFFYEPNMDAIINPILNTQDPIKEAQMKAYIKKLLELEKKFKNAAEVSHSSDLMKILSRKNRLFRENDPETRTNRSNE